MRSFVLARRLGDEAREVAEVRPDVDAHILRRDGAHDEGGGVALVLTVEYEARPEQSIIRLDQEHEPVRARAHKQSITEVDGLRMPDVFAQRRELVPK